MNWENCNNMQIHRREAKHKQEKAEQLNWYRSSPTEECYKDKSRDWSKAKLN